MRKKEVDLVSNNLELSEAQMTIRNLEARIKIWRRELREQYNALFYGKNDKTCTSASVSADPQQHLFSFNADLLRELENFSLRSAMHMWKSINFLRISMRSRRSTSWSGLKMHVIDLARRILPKWLKNYVMKDLNRSEIWRF